MACDVAAGSTGLARQEFLARSVSCGVRVGVDSVPRGQRCGLERINGQGFDAAGGGGTGGLMGSAAWGRRKRGARTTGFMLANSM